MISDACLALRLMVSSSHIGCHAPPNVVISNPTWFFRLITTKQSWHSQQANTFHHQQNNQRSTNNQRSMTNSTTQMHQCVESSVWAVYSHSAVGINCCNCPSSTVRRTVPQNSAIGSTCVCVKSLKFDAIINDAKSRHSPIRSRKNPKYRRVVPRPHSSLLSLQIMHCNTCNSPVHKNRLRLPDSAGIDVLRQWQNMARSQCQRDCQKRRRWQWQESRCAQNL